MYMIYCLYVNIAFIWPYLWGPYIRLVRALNMLSSLNKDLSIIIIQILPTMFILTIAIFYGSFLLKKSHKIAVNYLTVSLWS